MIGRIPIVRATATGQNNEPNCPVMRVTASVGVNMGCLAAKGCKKILHPGNRTHRSARIGRTLPKHIAGPETSELQSLPVTHQV